MNPAKAKILIASGGSGGHIFPAVALAGALKSRGLSDIRFVGSDKALDRRVFEKEGYRYWTLSDNKLPYKVSFALVTVFVKLFFDLVKSLFIVISYRPDAVVGFGGYVSFPVILTASIFRIPRIAHEQNVVPGRANRLLFGFADRIAVTFDETRRFLPGLESRKSVLTGNPIRREIFNDDRPLGIRRFGLDEGKFTILVIGGSQGAHFLNRVFIKSLALFNERSRASLQVIHLTGVKDYEYVMQSYQRLGPLEHRVHSFIDRIEEAYSASDMIVTRAGASAIFEAAFFGRPMILVPYPFALSHQAENARVFSERGAAIEIEERSLSPELFKETITRLLDNRDKLKSMSKEARRLSMPEAADRLADEVLALCS